MVNRFLLRITGKYARHDTSIMTMIRSLDFICESWKELLWLMIRSGDSNRFGESDSELCINTPILSFNINDLKMLYFWGIFRQSKNMRTKNVVDVILFLTWLGCRLIYIFRASMYYENSTGQQYLYMGINSLYVKYGFIFFIISRDKATYFM